MLIEPTLSNTCARFNYRKHRNWANCSAENFRNGPPYTPISAWRTFSLPVNADIAMKLWSRIRTILTRGGAQPAPCCVYSIQVHGNRGEPRTLTRLSPEGEYSQAAIDPEGRKVAFWGCESDSTEYHLWVADIGTHTCSRLTTLPGLHGHPAWWPDGKSLVCFSTAGVSNSTSWEAANQFSTDRPSANLFRISIETGKRDRLTHGDWIDERPSVSPHGDEVIFVSNRSGALYLWALDVASSKLRQVTRDSDLDYRPAFSPGGNRVAYFTRTADGSHQLAVIRWPELTPERIDTGRDFKWAHGPSWCHASNRLLFHALHRSDARPTLWLIDLDTMELSRLTLPGLQDCSHGSLDRLDSVLAFDSRERLRRPQPKTI